MSNETMKAGPELDARLCELLEPRPEACRVFVPETGQWLTYSISQHGFWDWRDKWYPIPVSTDGTAMVKAAEVVRVQLDCDIELTLYPPYRKASCVSRCWIYKEKPRNIGLTEWCYVAEGAGLPESFALSACEALEARAILEQPAKETEQAA